MKQILIIHGGNSFHTYDAYRRYLDDKKLTYDELKYHEGWKEWLVHTLPDYDVLLPAMPNSKNAVYDEWVIYFEKLVPFLEDGVQLVGHSLGATFLAKYLSTHTLPVHARKLVLIAGVYDDESEEDLGSFIIESTKGAEIAADEIHLFHSQDDPVVPYTELQKFSDDIPSAHVHSFTDRGHFFSITPTFPELRDVLKQK